MRQFSLHTDPARNRHLYAITPRYESYLMPGLNPDAPEFRHPSGIALQMFTDLADNHANGLVGDRLGHWERPFQRDRRRPVQRFPGHAKFGQAGNRIPVRAANRITEQFRDQPFHFIGDDMLPATSLQMRIFPANADYVY